MSDVVAIDFDGVLHAFVSGAGRLDPPAPGALAFVLELHRRGYRCVVLSSRAGSAYGKEQIRGWLDAHGFPAMDVTASKVPAVAYVDDRAVPITPAVGDTFDAALERIAWLAETPTSATPAWWARRQEAGA